LDATSFTVQSVIIHDVPRPAPDGSNGAILTDACTPLDADLRTYFQSKVRGSVERAGRAVVPLPPTSVEVPEGEEPLFERESPVPDLLEQYLSGEATEDDLVPFSQGVAQHLFAAQTRSMSPGLLLVLRGVIGGDVAVALLKVEREEGLGLEYEEVKGQHVMSVEHLRNIMMTENTKVYKAGVFGLSRGSLVGIASDEQSGPATVGAVAAFFLRGFLGCEYAEDSAALTERFYKITSKFLRERVGVVARADYLHSMLVEIQSNAPTINVAAFCRNHISEDHRDEYLNEIRDQGIPTDGFQKDVGLIANRISNLELRTEGGIRVVAPSEEYGLRHVEVSSYDEGETIITIVGRINRIATK
jgi:hypothetical protein